MTPQVPEQLLHRGRRLDMCAAPLDSYLARIPKVRRPRFLSTSTACQRGYVGTWEIQNGRLLLVELEGLMEQEGQAVVVDLHTALPWLRSPLHAHWLTDELRCPEGCLMRYHHASFYGSLYERDRLFWVERGRLRGEYLRVNPPQPLIYEIQADGTRTPLNWNGEDPLAGDDEPQGWKLWGRPPDRGEGYMIGGWSTHPPELGVRRNRATSPPA